MTTRSSCPECGRDFDGRWDSCPECDWKVQYWNTELIKQVGLTPKSVLLSGVTPFVALMVTLALLSGGPSEGRTSSTTGSQGGDQVVEVGESAPIPWEMAEVDYEDFTLPLRMLNRSQAAFQRAEENCQSKGETLADRLTHGMNRLQEQGTNMTLLLMMGAVDEAVPPEAEPMDCSEVIAVIITGMGK